MSFSFQPIVIALFIIPFVVILGCRRPLESESAKRFTAIPDSVSGVGFENVVLETPESNAMLYDYFYNGGGVAAGDFNNDGLCDLFFTANQVSNALYLNRGNFKFTEISQKAGVGGQTGWRTGVCTVDINADGWLDVYISHAGISDEDSIQNELYINQGLDSAGIPTFKEQAEYYQLNSKGTRTTHALFFDYDRDGDLDMFQINHSLVSSVPRQLNKVVRGRYHPKISNRLYRNDNGIFRNVTESSGVFSDELNSGLSAVASDLNDDGWLDLYVTNDYQERDYLFINKQDGTFGEAGKSAFGHTSKFSMGCDIADLNNDLLPDIIVTDMLPDDLARQKMLRGPDGFEEYRLMVDNGFHHQVMRNVLQIHQGVDDTGIPRFSEIGQLAGLQKTDWSWTALAADFDNDRDKDLFITNGYLRDFTNLDFIRYTYQSALNDARKTGTPIDAYQLLLKMPAVQLSNYCFANQGANFKNVTTDWGLREPMLSSGAVYADLDNDGDLEIITNNTNRVATIWRNNTMEQEHRSYVAIKLVGAGQNRQCIGSKVIVTSGTSTQVREVTTSHGFQSSTDATMHFGLGKDDKFAAEIFWPDGTYSRISNLKPNQLHTIPQASTPATKLPKPTKIKSAFRRVLHNNTFQHIENKFVDFKLQFLLLKQYSHSGPYLSKGDLNNDGLDDFFMGQSSGTPAKVIRQIEPGIFHEDQSLAFREDRHYEDAGSCFFDADRDGDLDLFVASGGSQPGLSFQDRIYINVNNKWIREYKALPLENENATCVAPCDFDLDGDVDIFVGGGVDPGRFPNASSSMLLRNDWSKRVAGPRFSNATPLLGGLVANLIVNAATWKDIDKNGWPDLIIASEYADVKILLNQEGQFTVLRDSTLAFSKGMWSSVLVEDIDLDGDDDIVAGNWGKNQFYTPSPRNPLRVYADDFDQNGSIDPIYTITTDSGEYPIISRDELVEQIPALKKKFNRYSTYARANLTGILKQEQLSAARKYEVNTFASTIFYNDHLKFASRDLPAEAQHSHINSIIFDDFDGDGTKEILVSGNFHSMRAQYGPSDASFGVIFYPKRDNTNTVTMKDSGLDLGGDVRAAIILNSKPGRLLLVGKNSDLLTFYQLAPR